MHDHHPSPIPEERISYRDNLMESSNLQDQTLKALAPAPTTEFNIINEKTKESGRVHVPITLCLAILTSYICGGGMLFSLWEGWDYLDGSYFCFVTLSTYNNIKSNYFAILRYQNQI